MVDVEPMRKLRKDREKKHLLLNNDLVCQNFHVFHQDLAITHENIPWINDYSLNKQKSTPSLNAILRIKFHR